MGRTCMIIVLAVFVIWTFGETQACDECGRECIPSCGTRRFQACCHNNHRKRTPDVGLNLWNDLPKETEYLNLLYDE